VNEGAGQRAAGDYVYISSCFTVARPRFQCSVALWFRLTGRRCWSVRAPQRQARPTVASSNRESSTRQTAFTSPRRARIFPRAALFVSQHTATANTAVNRHHHRQIALLSPRNPHIHTNHGGHRYGRCARAQDKGRQGRRQHRYWR
jgi:hypothetical protein